MSWVRRFGLCASVVAMMPLAAASQERDLAGLRIGISTGSTELFWDERAFLALQNAVIERGGTPLVRDAELSDARQIADLDALIGKEPDAITVLLGNEERLAPAFQRVTDAGIPLFTISMHHPGATHVTSVNSYANSVALTIRLAQDLRGQGQVLVFNGFYDVPLCKIRFDMLDYVLQEQPGILRIDPELEDQAADTIEKARADVAAVLAAGTQVDAIWSCWDTPLMGALEALDEAGRADVKIYGFGGAPDILARMTGESGGSVGGIVALDPEALAEAHISVIADYLNDKEIAPFAMVSGEVLHPESPSEAIEKYIRE